MILAISDRSCYLRRAARALLDWSQQQLADAARVGVVTVRQFEGGASQPRNATLEVLERALAAAGVEFIAENGGGAGVRLRRVRRFRELDGYGREGAREAYAFDAARLPSTADGFSWREDPQFDQKAPQGSGFAKILATVRQDGIATVTRETKKGKR
jgi:transcriptional regulator with XRE-family HTH domain